MALKNTAPKSMELTTAMMPRVLNTQSSLRGTQHSAPSGKESEKLL